MHEQWHSTERDSIDMDLTLSKSHSAVAASGIEQDDPHPAPPLYEDGKYGFSNYSGRRDYGAGNYTDRFRDHQSTLVSDSMLQDYYGQDRKSYGRR